MSGMNRTTSSDLPRELLIQITYYLQDTHPCLPLMLPHTRFSEHTPALSCAVTQAAPSLLGSHTFKTQLRHPFLQGPAGLSEHPGHDSMRALTV